MAGNVTLSAYDRYIGGWLALQGGYVEFAQQLLSMPRGRKGAARGVLLGEDDKANNPIRGTYSFADVNKDGQRTGPVETDDGRTGRIKT